MRSLGFGAVIFVFSCWMVACGGGGTAANNSSNTPPPAPTASVSPASLTFASTGVGSSAATQTVTLSNTGNAALTGTIAITGTDAGDFSQTNTCGSSLAAGSKCTITVTFTPTAAGSRTAALTATGSNVTPAPSVPLTGTGVGAVASLSASTADFGTVTFGSSSSAQNLTLSNTGAVVLNISSIAVTGTDASDFAQSGNCGTTLAAGANCTIGITFTPGGLGARSATLTLSDDASNSTTQTVALTGTGAGGISEVEPSSGPVAGGTIVSIVGKGFETGANVTFGGAAATNVSMNQTGTLIQATAPAGTAGTATVSVTNPDNTVEASGFTYTSATAGCGSDCGDVGDPYQGQGAPPNEMPIAACTTIQAAGNYILTQNVSGTISGTDSNCLHVDYPNGPVILDLGGYTVTGTIEIDSNATGSYGLLNGTVTCNADQGACVTWGVTQGQINNLTVENDSLTPLANINITGIVDSTVTAPILHIDHVTSTVVASAANYHRTRNIMDDGASGSNPALESVPVEENNNLITCSDNASACQGIELYDAPYSNIHNNQISLPLVCSTCIDSARGILFDQFSDYGVAAYNEITVNSNRGVRVRATHHINIHDNVFTSVSQQGRLAAIHVGETGGGIDDDFVSVYNNSFQLGPIGNGVTSSAAADVYVFDNSVSCMNNDCSQAGYLARTDVPDTVPADQTGGNLNVMNNNVSVLDAANVTSVHICGPTGNGTYDCSGSPTATTSGIVCNNGTVAPTGDGVITIDTPPCPPPPVAPEPRALLRARRP